MKDNTHKKKECKFKDELHTFVIKNTIAIANTTYSYNYQALDDSNEIVIENKKVLNGVSTIVVEHEIKDQGYKDALEKGTIAKRGVTRLRSFDHQVYTYTQNKVALTSHYDNMQMINEIDCVPFGYNPS